MRIPCPFCGDRDAHEFVTRGDAAPQRPAAGASEDAFADYVYQRDNPRGRLSEYWYHAQGCRNWLIVERDTRTHEVFSAALASGRAP
jgi:methylglutamate dehydrogenase subunit B